MSATFENIQTGTYLSGENLNGANDIYALLKLNASGQVVKTTAATDVPIGVLGEKAIATGTGQAVQVVLLNGSDKIPMRAVGAITRGNLIVPSTTAGKVDDVANLAAIATGALAVGIAMEAAAAADEIIQVKSQLVAGSA